MGGGEELSAIDRRVPENYGAAVSASRLSSRLLLPTSLAVAMVALLAAPASAAPGDLDPTFGRGGGVITRIGYYAEAESVAIQPDGKIVVAGSSNPFVEGLAWDAAVVRYLPTGALDPKFGSNGKVTTPIGSYSDYGFAVALQSDGKILVAGVSYFLSIPRFALVRYTSTGALDTTFGSGGKVVTGFGNGYDFAQAVGVQSDGKIVVAGYSSNFSDYDFAMVRYTTAGALDPTFGSGGKVRTPIGSGDDRATALAIQSDDRIVLAGYSMSESTFDDFALVRYTSNGALDPTWGSGGIVTTSLGGGTDQAQAVAVQANGKIVVAGSTHRATHDFAVVRYLSTGVLDTTFSSDGKVATDFASDGDVAYGVAIQSNGRIVAAGEASVPGFGDTFGLARYTISGALDSTFGSGGRVMTTGEGAAGIRGVALQSDGKIVVAGSGGYTVPGSAIDFTVARYLGDPIT